MHWLLVRMIGLFYPGGMSAWDEETVDEFVKAFPEAKRTLRYYLMGPNSSPMLNRAAARAMSRGYIRPGVIGCQDARSYNRRTWARYWSVTDFGWEYLRKTEPEAVAAYRRRRCED
jgi:hypothetical protein